MSRIFACGLGAVSPAGWGVPALRRALDVGMALPTHQLSRPGWSDALRIRPVPDPAPRPACLGHPRLRRASSITHYVAASALETLAGHPADHLAGKSVGLVMCLNAGCVHYSCRFYEEMLRDPATASPLVFPETVFSALASHVAALFENIPLVYTLVGDSASFLQGVALATQWLDSATVDICIVIGAEEANWLLADALWQLEHRAVLSAGAGAIALTCHPQLSMGVELASITDAHTFGSRLTRANAAERMRAQLPPFAPAELLCDGTSDSVRASAPELRAWQEWPGSRLSPKRVLGEGLMAAAAWQCVAACAAVANSACSAANLSLVGSNQQAIGARFIPHPSTTISPQL